MSAHVCLEKKWSRVLRVWWIAVLGIFVLPVTGSAQEPLLDNQAVTMAAPRIDLASVERAIWQTSASHVHDFRGWLQRFEDDVNAIYFATLRQQYPQTPPDSLLPHPVRVEPRWVGGLLYLYGYLDQNNVPGFQQGQDVLLFTFQQTRPYTPGYPLSYSLYDGSGYYYRDDSYSYAWGGAIPFFAGFFLYPQYWRGTYWRTSFAWLGTPYWSSGVFYNRYHHYYRVYPTYHSAYRTTYYTRYRPWGWNRGVYFRSTGGRYYYRNPRWVVQYRRTSRPYRTWIRQRHTIRRTTPLRYRRPVKVRPYRAPRQQYRRKKRHH